MYNLLQQPFTFYINLFQLTMHIISAVNMYRRQLSMTVTLFISLYRYHYIIIYIIDYLLDDDFVGDTILTRGNFKKCVYCSFDEGS